MFNLIPYTRSQNSLFNMFDHFEREFFGNSIPAQHHFRTDIVDQGDKYILNAELPGFAKEDIKINLEENVLSISAQKEEKTEESKNNYIHRERRYGAFCRRFDVAGIDNDAIQASYADGVLTLELPKLQPPPVPPTRQIEIH